MLYNIMYTQTECHKGNIQKSFHFSLVEPNSSAIFPFTAIHMSIFSPALAFPLPESFSFVLYYQRIDGKMLVQLRTHLSLYIFCIISFPASVTLLPAIR